MCFLVSIYITDLIFPNVYDLLLNDSYIGGTNKYSYSSVILIVQNLF